MLTIILFNLYLWSVFIFTIVAKNKKLLSDNRLFNAATCAFWPVSMICLLLDNIKLLFNNFTNPFRPQSKIIITDQKNCLNKLDWEINKKYVTLRLYVGELNKVLSYPPIEAKDRQRVLNTIELLKKHANNLIYDKNHPEIKTTGEFAQIENILDEENRRWNIRCNLKQEEK